MPFPTTALPSAATWWIGNITGALIDTYITGPLNALRGSVPQTVIGTVTIAAGGMAQTSTIAFPSTLSAPPAILAVAVVNDIRAVTANQAAAATTTGVSVRVFTTAQNSVGGTAASYVVQVTYAGV